MADDITLDGDPRKLAVPCEVRDVYLMNALELMALDCMREELK